MIRLENIFFAYNSTSILSDFSLTAQNNKTTVLIGPSGCGKSTILRLINGLILPQRGSIYIGDEKLSEENKRFLRLQSGYVIQEGGLFPNMTALENITLMARRLKKDKSYIKQRLEMLQDLTHIDKALLTQYPFQLSGGQRQRISLIRALMLDPDVLLLDEPLGALDPMIRSDLQDSLLEIFQTLNKTVILVTHDLNEAAYLGNEIVLLNNGRIIQSGSIKNLIHHPVNKFAEKFIKAQRTHIPEKS